MVGVNKLKQMVGVAINTYLVAVAQRELEYHLVTLLCSQSIHIWSPRGSLNNILWHFFARVGLLALSYYAA